MHHICHTEGIILDSRNFGEAGKHYSIFTRDLGLIYATAQGVRKMSSKLRYVLQDFAYLRIDLVAGRNIFRVTNASKTNILENLVKHPETFKVFANMSRLLKRLLPGVEKNDVLFTDLLRGLSILEKISIKGGPAYDSENDFRNVEAIIVLRILNNLGYIGENDILKNLIKSPFEENLIMKISESRTQIMHQINKALRETHL